MIRLHDFMQHWHASFPELDNLPWNIVQQARTIIEQKIKTLGTDYIISENVAIHRTAVVERHAVLKGPIIISASCFVGAHAYLRGGVYLGEGVSIGPGCEIKSSFLMPGAALAHFNFAGDSLIGSNVNMEAGSVIANHYNEREDKMIHVLVNNEKTSTGINKFGALVGDHTRIGANAVLSPGTILTPKSIVKRLELIEQC